MHTTNMQNSNNTSHRKKKYNNKTLQETCREQQKCVEEKEVQINQNCRKFGSMRVSRVWRHLARQMSDADDTDDWPRKQRYLDFMWGDESGSPPTTPTSWAGDGDSASAGSNTKAMKAMKDKHKGSEVKAMKAMKDKHKGSSEVKAMKAMKAMKDKHKGSEGSKVRKVKAMKATKRKQQGRAMKPKK